MGDAIEALNDLCNDLSSTLKTVASLSAEIAAKDYVRVDNIQEVRSIMASRVLLLTVSAAQLVNVPGIDDFDDLDVVQKRALVCRELERIRSVYKANALTLLSVPLSRLMFGPLLTKAEIGAIEMLLLLLWRHLEYYSEGHHIDNPNLRAATARMIRFLDTPDTETFRAELARKLAPVLRRLDLVCNPFLF